MALSNRLMGLGLTLLILGSVVSACSKEGGYPNPEPTAVAGAESHHGAAPAQLQISTWGPADTSVGTVFNAQPDGGAALWFQVDQSLEGSDAVVTMDGQPLHSAISGELITATVPARFYATRGTHALHVTVSRGATSVQSNDVSFVVH